MIRVSGTERVAFLQGQLTQDVRIVDGSRSALYGWATAQGRLLCSGQLLDWRDALWLTVPATLAEAIARRLRMFVLRARATIDVADVSVFSGDVALDAAPLAQSATATWCATRVAGDPGRVLVIADRSAPDLPGAVPAGGWPLADIRAGIPSIAPATSEAFIPQMVNLDLLGGIAFGKGCYVGQEIVTRTRHLGRIRRRMYRFGCTGDEAVSPGDPVFSAIREVGRVVAATRVDGSTELLAVTQIDDADGPLHLDAARTRALQRLALPYPIPAN